MRIRVLFAVSALACVAAQAELYRWVDADGKVHYSDEPQPANVKQVETKKITGGKPGEAPLPYALQQAVKNFPVMLYSSECGNACTRARQFLAKRGVPYTAMDATQPAVQEELKKLTGGVLAVPVLKVGREALRGFEEGKWNTSLDVAGYPQTAVVPAPVPIKPATTAPTPTPASPAEAGRY